MTWLFRGGGLQRLFKRQRPLMPLDFAGQGKREGGGRNLKKMSSGSRKLKLKRRTPSPPSPRRERGRSPGHHQHHADINTAAMASASYHSDYPTTLLVRNLSEHTRPEDLRIPFERFGPVNDVYLPKNYYTGKPRGFGFVKYRNIEDAADAKYHMNNQTICGHQISVVFAKEDAKRPEEMLAKQQDT